MFTFTQAKQTIGEFIALTDHDHPCCSTEFEEEVQVNLWRGNSHLKLANIYFDPTKIGQGYVGGRTLDAFWRCLQVDPNLLSLDQLLQTPNFSQQIGSTLIMKDKVRQNWEVISARAIV